MSTFDGALISFTLLTIMLALYLPIIFFAVMRSKGQELTAGPVILYALVGAGLGIFEAFWRDRRLRNWMLSRLGILKFTVRWFWPS